MFDDLIQQAAEQYNVPASWISAVIETESSWNPNAYRAEPQIGDASYGLMQLLLKTAQNLGFAGSPNDLFKPEINIPLGASLILQLRSAYGDDFQRMYSAYNSGKPDAYQTSPQVAANVARAVQALEKYATLAVETLTASDGSGLLSVVLVGALLAVWLHKKR